MAESSERPRPTSTNSTINQNHFAPEKKDRKGKENKEKKRKEGKEKKVVLSFYDCAAPKATTLHS